jgi:hypothetical protein
VLLGINLYRQLEKNQMDQFSILAHEYGHILQYKKGMSPGGPWQMEPHADFLAGWCMGRNEQYHKMTPDELEKEIRPFFALGDLEFNERRHHGEPEFRAAMVRAGYESRDLDVNAAFEKGKKWAGLK